MIGRWVCGYVLEFGDGDGPEEQVLHVGTKEECERVIAMAPAIAYSGGRPSQKARAVVMPFPLAAGAA